MLSALCGRLELLEGRQFIMCSRVNLLRRSNWVKTSCRNFRKPVNSISWFHTLVRDSIERRTFRALEWPSTQFSALPQAHGPWNARALDARRRPVSAFLAPFNRFSRIWQLWLANEIGITRLHTALLGSRFQPQHCLFYSVSDNVNTMNARLTIVIQLCSIDQWTQLPKLILIKGK